MKIVVVDDDEVLVKILETALKSQNFEVLTFTEGKTALHYLLEEGHLNSISLLILDRLLPEMDGIAILKALIKKFGRIPPVLILSVLASEKDVLEGLQTGAVDYVVKPFSIPILLQKVNSLIGSKQHE